LKCRPEHYLTDTQEVPDIHIAPREYKNKKLKIQILNQCVVKSRQDATPAYTTFAENEKYLSPIGDIPSIQIDKQN
jgi:hypothetical protein